MTRKTAAGILGSLLVAAVAVCIVFLLARGEKGAERSPATESAGDTETRNEPGAATLQGAGQTAGRNVPDLRFHPTDGQTLCYRIHVQSELEIDLAFVMPRGFKRAGGNPQGETTGLKTDGTGTLCLKLYADPEGGWNVAAGLQDPGYSINEQVPAFASSLNNPFVFRMRSDGGMRDFQFPPGTPEQARKVIQAILLSMEIVYPAEGSVSWKATETNTTGTYEADYRLEGSCDRTCSIVKRKTQYIKASLADQPYVDAGLAASRIHLDRSEERFVLSPENGTLRELNYVETYDIRARGKTWAANTGRLEVKEVTPPDCPEFPARFSDYMKEVKSDRYVVKQYYATESELDRMGRGLEVPAAVGLYQQLAGDPRQGGGNLAERFMVNYLRQYPGAPAELVAYLDRDGDYRKLGKEEHLVLWRLITEAGHPDAQRAVSRAATNPGFSDQTHIRALLYVSDFAFPEPFLVSDLWEISRKPEAYTSNGQAEQAMKSASILAIGVLGSEDKLNDAVKQQIKTELAAHLEKASAPEDRAILLQAIGNTANEGLIGAVTPYFKSESPQVRAAAYAALRRMSGRQAWEIFTESFQQETSEEVRRSALRDLTGNRDPDPELVDWATRQLFRVSDPSEQVQLVAFLGQTIGRYPENGETLRRLYEKDPAFEVKEQIFNYIAPDPP